MTHLRTRVVLAPALFATALGAWLQGTPDAASPATAPAAMLGAPSARASANIKVIGLDKAFAQELARLAQDDLIAQLRRAGFAAFGWGDPKVQAQLADVAREVVDAPPGVPVASEGGQTHSVAAPSDAQRFKPALAGGLCAEFLHQGKSRISDATLILTNYIINAPQSWADSRAGLSLRVS